MVTLQYGFRSPINCFFIDELIWGYLVPVSEDENVTISFIRTSKTRIICLYGVPKSDVSKCTFMPK